MTEYPVHTIRSEAELDTCPLFRVNHFQWTCLRRPCSIGRMGYLPGVGFLLSMECHEQNPKREYTAPQSPVCRDSAMEAFFSFTQEQPTADSMYLNLEINANGAMLAKAGAGRKNRKPLSEAAYAACACRAEIAEDCWRIRLLIPLPLITELCDRRTFARGDHFFCNFYKISESPEIEHYAAYSPLTSETPNFHMPACFAKAVLV